MTKILNDMEANRDKYLNQLIESQDNGLIKIITGIRRSGKSYLLFKLFADYLVKIGLPDDHIVRIDLENYRNRALRQPDSLLDYIDNHITADGKYVVLLDEIQTVPHFEEVLNSYLKISNVDIYVTGSNSRFLSTDIITEFRGRGEEIHLNPLTFSEYYSAVGGDKSDAWKNYYTFGGLPHILSLNSDEKKVQYLLNLYSTVYKKNLIERNAIAKADEFEDLLRIVASSIGSPINPLRIENTFKSVMHNNISNFTISRYLGYMQDAFLIEKSIRYDVKGRKYLGSLSKYYFTDIGLRNALIEFRQQEETHIMENIIYNELRTRGFRVDVGIIDVRGRNENNTVDRTRLEIDFVANTGSKRYYIQSALSIPDADKLRQETRSLLSINDNFRKIVIVKDNIKPWHTDDGILVVGLFDFLLNPSSIDL